MSPRLAALSNAHPALWRCWHPVARASEVGEGPHRVLLLGEPWVLVRLGPGGTIRAFLDRCPHRSAPLSIGAVDWMPAPSGDHSGAGDPEPVLRCAYHGWCFDRAGHCVELPALGAGATIPPRARLRAAHAVHERHGTVFLLPTPPVAGCTALPTIPEADDASFMAGDLPPLRVRAAAGYLADNFLDMAHFPFVHAATFGAEDPVVPPLTVERAGLSFSAESEHDFANREDPGVADGTRPIVQRRRVAYRVHAPFHLVLRLDFLDAGGTNVIGFFLQPESDDSCRIYSTIWRNDLGHDAGRMADAVAFEVRVVKEDLAVQGAFDVHALPLDPTIEVHTRADRATLELRRMLADLVVAAAEEPGASTGAAGGATGAVSATPGTGTPPGTGTDATAPVARPAATVVAHG